MRFGQVVTICMSVGYVIAGVPKAARAQTTPQQFYQSQTADFVRALGNPNVNARVRRIWMQLATATNRMYPVVPAQQYNMGQALPNGVITLDVAIAGNDDAEVTAFWLAHEWAHQYLGHSAMLLYPLGRWAAARAGTAQEDLADKWAGRFLKAEEYDLEPVLNFLCALPEGRPGDTHSSPDKRARQTARSAGMTDYEGCEQDPDPQPPSEEEMQACLERKVVRCMESCQTSYGRPYNQCVVLCSINSANNRRVWVPDCRKEIGDERTRDLATLMNSWGLFATLATPSTQQLSTSYVRPVSPPLGMRPVSAAMLGVVGPASVPEP
jgi:hypothetical protein